jgi:hypothetical protein
VANALHRAACAAAGAGAFAFFVVSDLKENYQTNHKYNR